ncbi:hypothetical protein BHE74_00024470 [Ensete ventricosum]|nr:hypothetical protein GW17_00032472 [Ensete ventricosum]RWW68035.1 hypothetical protein BHE74_00024470 [Ensete ventricosum]RZS02897.1 hypothetical protein BHM03_00033003 [Ensete ventricosum]
MPRSIRRKQRSRGNFGEPAATTRKPPMEPGEGSDRGPPTWSLYEDPTTAMQQYSGPSSDMQARFATLQRFLPRNRDVPAATDSYSTNEFRMYVFKVRPCPRGRSHDWTECPFLHPGEKARRRDPRRFHYSSTPCPDFRQRGECCCGDACQLSHGIFETWLHPARYRTRTCKDGIACRRRVCFFAHCPEQLRIILPLRTSPVTMAPRPISPPESPVVEDEVAAGLANMQLSTAGLPWGTRRGPGLLSSFWSAATAANVSEEIADEASGSSEYQLTEEEEAEFGWILDLLKD